jgi:hypothetical protein
MLITDELKDKILKKFIDSGSITLQANIHDLAKEYKIDRDVVEAILNRFEELGFFEQRKCLGGRIDFSLKVPAFDFYARGGFTAQEELLQKNIEKLLLEIESLKPSMPGKIETITSIAANITTALGLFIR